MPVWTSEQLGAINTRDKTLLVSAAAGSGKTATLTERVIRSLTDTENPISIESLLVVTFTKAAASELKSKISKELSRAVRENPENSHLARQLYMLPSAKICTIDSYCGEILRSNCERVGIAPGYRIADGVECELLASSILNGLIDEIYSGRLADVASAEELSALAECLTDAKHPESLDDILRELYRGLETLTDGVDALYEIAELYTPESSPHISYIAGDLADCARHYLAAEERAKNIFSSGTEEERKYVPICEQDIALLKTIVYKNDYKSLKETLEGCKFATLPSVPNKMKTDAVFDYITLRDSMKSDLVSYKKYFLYNEDEIPGLLSDMREMILVLYRVMKEFDRVFCAEKYRIGALSFADVARLAHRCLWQDGKPTDIALSIRDTLSAVYIDEYQDVNDIQESIFRAVSREDNRFMVGDIKQSIYRFRHANPEIFTRTKRSLPDISNATTGASLFMSRNFRSDRAVVDFINEIFDRVFGLCGESIDYRADDKLVFGKSDTAPEYRRPEICLINKAPRGRGDEDEEEDVGIVSDPKAVALKIKSLIDGEKLNSGERIEPKDVAIILRTMKGKAELYAEELSRVGITSRISGDKEFFLSSEVLLAMSLLNSIDNPRRDVYLAALMSSPLYSFTQEELYVIRSSCPADTLYSSLVLYAESTGDEKCKSFLDILAHYRRISEGISIDRLLYRLYRETGLFALAKKSGGADNLRLLYDYARRYAEGEFKGLYSFISFINSIEDKQTSFDEKRDGGDANSVSIISVHASKGLEYPVVFLANASGKMFGGRQRGARLHFAGGFGVGLKLRDKSSVALVQNPIYDIVRHYKERADYEEELRLLYVALTRARERLFIVGTSPKTDREKLEHEFSVIHDNLSGYSMRQARSHMDVVLSATGFTPIDEEGFLCGIERDEENTVKAECDSSREVMINTELYESFVSRFGFKYPYIHETALPEKLSVSKASPTVLDGTEGEYPGLTWLGESADDKGEEGEFREHLPAFTDGGVSDESAKRGIATHYFLQFCDLRRFEETSAERELAELCRTGFISERDARRVRLSEIRKFKASGLFADMLSAKNLYRELRFNIHVPCKYFTEDELRLDGLSDQTILVQGVIDCVIEYPDGSFGVFDYKTDRLTPEELASRPLAEARMSASHKRQLQYYALATEAIFGKAPTRVEVYSLHFGDTLSIGI